MMVEPDDEIETAYVSLKDLKKENEQEKKRSFAEFFKCCLPICAQREKPGILDDQMSQMTRPKKSSR